MNDGKNLPEKNPEKNFLYMKIYARIQRMILEGQIPPGARLPSIRSYAQEHSVSRITVENAYLQLAADGYIISRPQSGYYATGIGAIQKKEEEHRALSEKAPAVMYDLSSPGADPESFRFDLWQRYLKSAVRKDDRLLSYGEPQGEYELREVLSSYVRQSRNILCSPDSIVVSAGFQSLLQILCPLLKERHTVSFPTSSFVKSSTVFEDYGFEVHYRDKDCQIIYVSPAHMTAWGEVMSVKRRMELLGYSQAHGSLILEDDYENEFVYLQKPTPSLYSLSGSRNVVYIGSFSRLLLPSIRISFMILPPDLLGKYLEKKERYNQTASKIEQIALCQFIRDGHLASQIRRLKRLYSQKLEALQDAAEKVFGREAGIRMGKAGTSMALTVPSFCPGSLLKEKAQTSGLRFSFRKESPDTVTVILSCSSLSKEDFLPALTLLKNIL